MYEVRVKNVIENREFKEKISSPYLLHKFLKKIKYSKKLKLMWIETLF